LGGFLLGPKQAHRPRAIIPGNVPGALAERRERSRGDPFFLLEKVSSLTFVFDDVGAGQ
jgi:hypothetical protein